SATTRQALAQLAASGPAYAIVEVKGRPYHVQADDVVVVPYMAEVALGDVLALDRVRELGTATHVLRGSPYVAPAYYAVELTVLEHAVSKERITLKRKRDSANKLRRSRTHNTYLRVSRLAV
ncbi:hypothetical protein CXG81DRAFT_1697, partial [Caulochytrium protostelioides]